MFRNCCFSGSSFTGHSVLVASQINELNIIRQSLYDLESQHGKIRQHQEEEIARLSVVAPFSWGEYRGGCC